mmetsp:Transcript_41574/g.96805  ORF Transcript_41574/g.96805 Transcript_41574/m.96805 type:complete len:670 (-) Transcript_41574:115-2124(-)
MESEHPVAGDELEPALPANGRPAATQQPAMVFRVAGICCILGCTLLFTVALPRAPGKALEGDARTEWHARKLLSACTATDCGQYATPNGVSSCDGLANSNECQQTCCGPIKCSELPGSCEAIFGPEYTQRVLSYWEAGHEHRKLECQGQNDCQDHCCQGVCDRIACAAPTPCSRNPWAPARCTPSTCQEQCCYGDDYCGNGLNAWTEACKACETAQEYCERILNLNFASTSTDAWNAAVLDAVRRNILEPGCEIDSSPSCEDALKFRLISVFPFHGNSEAVSVNDVDVIAGGTVAISGGDDYLVFSWRIADGHLIRNYTGHDGPVRTVDTFNDATYFCATSKKEAIVWRNVGPEDSGLLGMEFTPEDPREGQPTPEVTSCTGLNTWETAVVGQSNSFAQIWKWKQGAAMPVPLDPKLQYAWQIDKDAGYHRFPDRFHGHSSELKSAFTKWRKNLFGLLDGYERRLQNNATADEALARRLRPADRTAPWTNWFTNIHWGDVPDFYYEPHNWGPVTSLTFIPSDTLFAVGYQDGSIRVWRTYNGFITAIVPKAHDGAVTALVSAPAGGTLYSGGEDGLICMWEAVSGKPRGEMYAKWAGPVLSLAMIPGGNNIYSGHATGLLLLWIPGQKKLWCQLDPKKGRVNGLAVNPGKIGQVLLALQGKEARVYEMR